MDAGALTGIRVLEFSQIVAGPYLGCILSDLGAEVVKVERPGGDFHRNWGAVVPHEGKRFQSLNRGKRSIVVDIGQPQGREVIRQLVRGFDVVTNNFRANIAQRLGIDLRDAAGSATGPHLLPDQRLGHERADERPRRQRPRDLRLLRTHRRRRQGVRGRRAADGLLLGGGGPRGGPRRGGRHRFRPLSPRAHGRGPAHRRGAAAGGALHPADAGDARARRGRDLPRPDGGAHPRGARRRQAVRRRAGGAAKLAPLRGSLARLLARLRHERRRRAARRDHPAHPRHGPAHRRHRGRPQRRSRLRRERPCQRGRSTTAARS